MINVIAKRGGMFFEEFCRLYSTLSKLPFPGEIEADSGLEDFLCMLYKACGQPEPVILSCSQIKMKWKLPVNRKVVVGFSSGKDSLAVALKLRKDGYQPTLFYVGGINRVYPHERIYAKKLAGMLNMPIVESDVRIKGKLKDFIGYPLRNQLVLAMMVEYGLANDISTFALGCDDYLDSTVNHLYNLSDSIELISTLDKYYKPYLPGYRCLCPIRNGTDAYWTIWQLAPKLFTSQAFSSCMMPAYRKAMVRAANIRKGIKLEESRCGSCKKCAYEYIHRALFGTVPINLQYLEKCAVTLLGKAYHNQPVNVPLTIAEAVAVYIDVPFVARRASGWEACRATLGYE